MAQNVKNHTARDPMTLVIGVFLLINFFFSLWYTHKHYWEHRHLSTWWIVMSVVFLLMLSKMRSYSLKVQDRVIRLEEKVRLASLVSASELAELESLTIAQYVALRFASNPELPELARRAVREKLTRKQIKEAIKSWRPDEYRV